MSERRRPSFMFMLFLFAIIVELGILISIFKGDANPAGNIAVVEVVGPIDSSLETIKQLKKFEKNDKVKAIVLRVDSPGGTVGASQEMHDEIKRINARKKIVVSMGDVAASGGYYIAAPAAKIIANAGTITGSIGVIAQYFVFDEVLKKFNIKWELIKAGERKDIGSPFRNLAQDERNIMESMTNDMHAQFIEAVAQGRKLELAVAKKLADGRVYSGRQAQQAGLVDELGGLEHAIKVAANLAQVADIKPIYPKKDDMGMLSKVLGLSTLKNILNAQSSITAQYRL